MIDPDDHLGRLDDVSGLITSSVESAFAAMLERIREGSAPRDAAHAAFASFSGEYMQLMRSELSLRLERSISAREIVSFAVSDVTLSQALHGLDEQGAARVTQLVRDEAAGWQDARRLARRIFDGYGPARDDAIAPRTRLPVFLRRAFADDTAFRRLWDRDFARSPLAGIASDPITGPPLSTQYARIKAAQLRTPALQASYLQAIDAIESGAGAKRLENLMRTAWVEKTRFVANRIAQTELHRAFTDRRSVEIMQDEELQAVRIRLSSQHPRTDICDLHAKANVFGLGPGVYPKAQAPVPPFHPFCRCVAVKLFSVLADGSKERSVGHRVFLRSLSRDEAAQVMGSKARLGEVLAGRSALDVVNRNIPERFRTVSTAVSAARSSGAVT